MDMLLCFFPLLTKNNNNNNNININNNNKNNSKNKEKCPRMTIEKGNSNLLIEYVYYIKKKKKCYVCMKNV